MNPPSLSLSLWLRQELMKCVSLNFLCLELRSLSSSYSSLSIITLSCRPSHLIIFHYISDPLSSLLPGGGSSLYAEQLRERELRERSALLGLGGLYPPPPEVRAAADHLYNGPHVPPVTSIARPELSPVTRHPLPPASPLSR